MNMEELLNCVLHLRLAEQDIFRQSLEEKQKKIDCLEEELYRLNRVIEKNIFMEVHK